jgi:hypothetical protein
VLPKVTFILIIGFMHATGARALSALLAWSALQVTFRSERAGLTRVSTVLGSKLFTGVIAYKQFQVLHASRRLNLC